MITTIIIWLMSNRCMACAGQLLPEMHGCLHAKHMQACLLLAGC
jgi:hypothetical protein